MPIHTEKTDDLPKELSNLRIGKKSLQSQLDQNHFTIFRVEHDLGYFGWRAHGNYQSLASVSAAEIRQHIDRTVEPDPIMNQRVIAAKLPTQFLPILKSRINRRNQYPYEVPHIASLHVLSRYTTVPVADIDFLFGGSTLEFLARRERSSNCYLACRVANVITIKKHKIYTNQPMEYGFQFERFVTGKPMQEDSQSGSTTTFIEHLQVLQVGTHFKVLFSAEADAMYGDDPVEIKVSSPRYWGTKVAFQMISSGSLYLCHGHREGTKLQKVTLFSLAQICAGAFPTRKDTLQWERNILEAMEQLKAGMEGIPEGEVHEILFPDNKNGRLELRRRDLVIVAPSSETIRKLLGQ